MFFLFISAGLFFNHSATGDAFQLIKHSDHYYSAKQGSQEYHYSIQPQQNTKIMRFENQGMFLEVIYFGLDQIDRIELSTNFSGEQVNHAFLIRDGRLLATQEAWHFVALIEPEGEVLFDSWQSLRDREEDLAAKTVDSQVVRRDPFEVSCTGLGRFGLGGDEPSAKESLNRNCDNFCCLGCCKHFGCSKISFFLVRCTGRACDIESSIFP